MRKQGYSCIKKKIIFSRTAGQNNVKFVTEHLYEMNINRKNQTPIHFQREDNLESVKKRLGDF